jgi:hypothetical protein
MRVKQVAFGKCAAPPLAQSPSVRTLSVCAVNHAQNPDRNTRLVKSSLMPDPGSAGNTNAAASSGTFRPPNVKLLSLCVCAAGLGRGRVRKHHCKQPHATVQHKRAETPMAQKNSECHRRPEHARGAAHDVSTRTRTGAAAGAAAVSMHRAHVHSSACGRPMAVLPAALAPPRAPHWRSRTLPAQRCWLRVRGSCCCIEPYEL